MFPLNNLARKELNPSYIACCCFRPMGLQVGDVPAIILHHGQHQYDVGYLVWQIL